MSETRTYVVTATVVVTYQVEAESIEDAQNAYYDGRIHASQDHCDWDTQEVDAEEA